MGSASSHSSTATSTPTQPWPEVCVPRVFSSSIDYRLQDEADPKSFVYFEDSRPGADAGTTIAICLPGIGDTRRQFRLLAPLLHDQLGLRVLVGDLRGFGDSTAFDTYESDAHDAYSPEAVATDLSRLMQQLHAAAPSSRFVLLGNSLSAGSLVLAALEAQKATPTLSIGALVLLGPILRDSPMDAWFRPLSHLLFRSLYGAWVWATYYKTLYPGVLPADFSVELETLKKHLSTRKRNIVNVGRFVRASKAGVASAVTQLGSLPQVAVLAFFGKKDPDYADIDEELTWFTQAVPHARHFEDAEGGHYPHLEHPERVIEALREALAADIATP